MPPSPVVRSLRGWKEKAARSAPAPTGRPRYTEPDRAGGVLDDRDAARLAECPHRVEVGRDARLVDEDDGAGALGQARLHRLRGEVLGRLVDVGEHRHAPRRSARRWRSR